MTFVNSTKEYLKAKFYGPTIYFVVGPTSSGKTAYSLVLAKELEQAAAAKGRRTFCEIISADSRQIFKDFNLLSGKITNAEMQSIPHHLLDIVNPGEYFSAVDFSKLANEKIQEILSRGNIPIVVGGTGFYIDNIIYNYNLPQIKANPELRKSLEKMSTSDIFEKIKFLDPVYANKEYQNKNNRHRMQRALEIATTVGRVTPLEKKLRYKNVSMININLKKEDMDNRIYKRLKDRFKQGMIEEFVSAKNKYNLSYEYLESLGLEFKYISLFLQDKIKKEEMEILLFEAIKKYAKRQITWFKRYNYL